jgi:glycerophosphoryl diester phosphodiesterase
MVTQRPLIVGHRGARGLAPENTIEGFEKAMEYDIDMIEFDIRQTKDDKLIVIHKHLRTPEGKSFVVRQTNYDELLKYDPTIPTAAEVIETVNRRVRLMVEIKPDVDPAPVAKLIKSFLKRGWQPEDFMLNSSSYPILKYLMDEIPEVERLIQGDWGGLRVTHLARKLKTPYILLDQRYLWWGFVHAVSRRGYKLFTYTFPWHDREPYNHHKAIRWIKHGVYGIVTDYPDHYTKKLTR